MTSLEQHIFDSVEKFIEITREKHPSYFEDNYSSYDEAAQDLAYQYYKRLGHYPTKDYFDKYIGREGSDLIFEIKKELKYSSPESQKKWKETVKRNYDLEDIVADIGYYLELAGLIEDGDSFEEENPNLFKWYAKERKFNVGKGIKSILNHLDEGEPNSKRIEYEEIKGTHLYLEWVLEDAFNYNIDIYFNVDPEDEDPNIELEIYEVE